MYKLKVVSISSMAHLHYPSICVLIFTSLNLVLQFRHWVVEGSPGSSIYSSATYCASFIAKTLQPLSKFGIFPSLHAFIVVIISSLLFFHCCHHSSSLTAAALSQLFCCTPPSILLVDLLFFPVTCFWFLTLFIVD